MAEETREQENIRNPDGTFKPGFSGNPNGRPKGTMKDYLRRKFMEMSDEDKETFLEKVSPELQIRLAEGNPHQSEDTNVSVTFPKPIDDLSKDDSIQENKGT